MNRSQKKEESKPAIFVRDFPHFVAIFFKLLNSLDPEVFFVVFLKTNLSLAAAKASRENLWAQSARTNECELIKSGHTFNFH